MPSDELRHRVAQAIVNKLSMRFPLAVRAVLAGEEQTRLPEFIEQETITVGGIRYITASGVGLLMGWTRSRGSLFARRGGDDRLPPRAARIGMLTLWQFDHIEAYRDRQAVEVERDHAEHLILDTDRLAVRLGRNVASVAQALQKRRPTVPAPTDVLGFIAWWDAVEVDAWLEAHPEHDPAVRERENREAIERNTLHAGGRALLTREGAYRTLRFSKSRFAEQRQRGALPEASARIGNMPLWLREDIEARCQGEIVQRKPGELQHLLMDAAQVGALLGFSPVQMWRRIQARSDELPSHGEHGVLNNFFWWDAAAVATWQVSRAPGSYEKLKHWR